MQRYVTTAYQITTATFVVGALLFAGLLGDALAAPNYQINYQGKLTDSTGATVSDGSYDMEFRLYTAATGGSAIWTETLTGGNQVAVSNGLFSVMLGSTTALSGVDFNQTLYLGVNIDSDGEMSPRKILGTVPAAFVAEDANTLGGVASTSFVRSDAADTITASTASTLLSVVQNGAGDILNLFDGGSEVFSVLDGGNIGIGTSTPTRNFAVDGDMELTGRLYDRNSSAGTNGFVLQTTGAGTEWVATTSLGFLTTSDFDTEAELEGILTDVTDVFTNNDGALDDDDLSDDTLDNLSQTALADPNGDQIVFWDDSDTQFEFISTLTGLAISDNTLSIDVTGDWTGTFDGQEGTYYLDRSNHTGTQSTTTISGIFDDASIVDALTVSAGGSVDSTALSDGGTISFDWTDDEVADTLTIGSGSTIADGLIVEADLNLNAPTNGYVLQASSTSAGGFVWVATSSLGFDPAGTDNSTNVTLAGTPNYLTLSGQEITLNQLDIADDLATFTSANLAGRLTDETGSSGGVVFANSPTLITPSLGTPSAATLTNATGLPISTGVSGLGSNVATFLATPSSANLASALTDETGTGNAVFSASPTFTGTALFAVASTTDLIVSDTATTTNLYLTDTIRGAGLTADCDGGSDKLLWDVTTGRFSCGADAGAGGGITALGVAGSYQSGSTQTFATTSDTNVTLSVTSAGDTHTFTPGWTGTLAVGRGGTGAGSFTAGTLLVGNGTGALTSTTTAGLKSTLALNNVENTALSTWPGTTNITTLGTIGTGVWQGSVIDATYLDTNLVLTSEIDTSSELAAILTDEEGTAGSVVFSNAPTFTGVAEFATASTSNLVISGTLTDTNNSAGTNGFVLQTTGVGTEWVATSSLGFDPAGTDNSTNVTLAGTPNYLTLSGQEITLNQLDIADDLATFTSANLAGRLTDETGSSGGVVFANSPTLITPSLGTPSAATLTNATGLPISTGVSGLGSNVATFLATPSSANLASALTDETGTGNAVFSAGPTFTGTALFAVASSTNASTTALTATRAYVTNLNSVTAIDATTEATIESAIDTLANLTSIQGSTVTLTDAGADAFFGWDDTASAYENLTAEEALAIIGGVANDFDANGDVTITEADISDFAISTGDITDGTIIEADLNLNAPTNGYVLQASSTSAGGFVWVATSTLGISSGSSVTFGTDNQIPYTNAGGTDYDYSSNLTFDGTRLHVLGSGTAGTPSVDATTVGVFQRSAATGNRSRLSIISGNTGDAELTFGDSDAQIDGFIRYENDNRLFAIGGASGSAADVVIEGLTGNVGIGTTTPASQLSIYGGLDYGELSFDTNDDTFTTFGSGLRIDTGFELNVDTNTSAVVNLDTDNNGTNNFFAVRTDGSATDLFTITDDGDVGIGSTTPLSQFTVEGAPGAASLATLNLESAAGSTILELANADSTIGSGSWFLEATDAGSQVFGIRGDGRVGIGDSSPSALLNIGSGNVSTVDGTNDLFVTDDIEVDGDGYIAGALDIIGSITNATWGGDLITSAFIADDIAVGSSGSVDSTALYDGGTISFDWVDAEVADALTISSSGTIDPQAITLATGNVLVGDASNNAIATSSLYIDNDGNIGLGTTSPNTNLEIADIDSAAQMSLYRYGTYTGTDNLGEIWFGYQNDGMAHIQAVRDGADDAAALKFSTQPTSGGTTERLRIDSNGNIGIGTTTPLTNLQVYGSGLFGTTNMASTANGYADRALNLIDPNAVMKIWRHTASVGQDPAIELIWGQGETDDAVGNVYWDVFVDASEGAFSIRDRSFGKGNAQRFVIATSGDIGIGTTTPNKRLQVFETVADDQFRISYDATRYADFQVDSVGDLIIDAQGGEVRLNDESLYVCEGGACPDSLSGTGNLVVENEIYVSSGNNPTEGTATSTFEGDVTIQGKLDVSVIDPVYRIDGVKYATYGMSSVGLKEETAMTVTVSDYNEETGYYEKRVAWSDTEIGSDLWLFYQVTDFGALWEYLTVSLTAGFDGRVFYTKDVANNALLIQATEPGEVSARMISNRQDWREWGSLRDDQDSDFTHFDLKSKP